ncbi:hypothetical protein CK203_104624 [Vitis vinifera]|uniref:Uncharacterized protein n=1 Tax=Vitis vinifera TaxID=29760 RepID=A0A438DP83_VITVI|nr:hypothetical protein CK203_104624 [Vitis vinifera]
MLIGPVVSMNEGPPMASMFFLVLTLSHGVHCDKIGVACIAANLVAHASTKHIGADVHFVCDKVLQKELDIQYAPTKDQVAGILTKRLSVSRFIVLKVEFNVKASPFR